ncbi:sensor domain-containing protein [Halorubrum sp. Boch-26]|uniref:sensor domain-containing protein n=1 Tax=Halorubrum sp. Boch-26 TaxID=2994426 RepID=UPI0024698569|nr:sensor domain-containing protein [Halorubrum sp. Boch-26]
MVSLRSPSDLPVVGVVADGRTYRHVLYLLLAVPLGFAYSTLFAFGVAFGLALSVVLVGVVILLATLIGARLAAGFERRLANALLGTHLLRPDDLAEGDGALAGVRKYVDARSTWTGIGFISLKFWVSLFAFVPVFLLASALPLIAAPLRYPYEADFGEVNGEPVTWAIDTLPEALIALPIGVVGVLLALHATNLVAYVARQMAVALLGRPDATRPRPIASEASAASGMSRAGGEDAADEDSGADDASIVDAGGADTDDEFDFIADPTPADRDAAEGDAADRGAAEGDSTERDDAR